MENKNINENFDYYFINPNYKQYMVQYEGDIKGEVEKFPEYKVIIVDDKYAIIFTKSEINLLVEYKKLSTIVNVIFPQLYTLQDINLSRKDKEDIIDIENPLDLTGDETIVAIIGTGIDYLSNEFIDEDGKSRIELIWDQTISSKEEYKEIKAPYGSIYTNKMINDAINTFRNGQNPYDIVPSRDESGHGTSLSGIVGGYNTKSNFKGVANKCRFISIKLNESEHFKREYGIDTPIYNLPSIYIALKFLYEYKLTTQSPIVILLPLGTNAGNHKGNGILEEFIEYISMSGGIVVVTGVGN